MPNKLFSLLTKGKDLDARAYDETTTHIAAGDIVIFNRTKRRKVVAVRDYPTFLYMFEGYDGRSEPLKRIAPGMSVNEAIALLRGVYPSAERHGVRVLELLTFYQGNAHKKWKK